MAPPVLWPHQDVVVGNVRAAMRRFRRIILCSPTGSGKSVMIAFMFARAVEKGLSAWLLVHREELLDQLSRTLWAAGVQHGIIMSGRPMTTEPVQLCSVQTLVRRLDKLRPPQLIAVDECHHSVASTYMKIIGHCPEAWNIGLTATPSRTDGRGLGDIYQHIVMGPTVAWLIANKFLAPYRLVAPKAALDVSAVHMIGGDFKKDELAVVMDRQGIIGDAVEHYRQYVAPRTCLVYCVNRLHAQHVTEGYRAAGIHAVYVCGDTDKDAREAAIRGFRTGTPPVIVSVDLFGEGLDVPGLSAVQLLRPTASLGLHLQQIGRSLRTEPGKQNAIILDHVGNTWRHGLPDDERTWTLDATIKRKKKAEESGPALQHCEQCFHIFRKGPANCPLCGHQVVAQTEVPEHQEGQLQEVDPEEHRRKRAEQWEKRNQERKATTLEDWVRIAIERGHKPGWAGVRHAIRLGFKPDSPDARAYAREARTIAAEQTRVSV